MHRRRQGSGPVTAVEEKGDLCDMDLLDYVNVRQGTRSSSCFSNGNTLPMTQLPFAMHAFVPQTTSDRGNWFYSPYDQTTEGIRLSHQPSPWIGDFTPLIFQPQRGQFYRQPKSRRSFFRREETVLRPDRLRMYFARYRTDMEVLPTQRGGVIRLRFDGDEPAALALFTLPGENHWELAGERLVTGSTNYHSWKTAENFCMYFAVFFS